VNAGSDTTIAALGLTLATTTNGTDLVGTIGGVAGTASGNTLKGAVGTSASGLTLDISSTTGGTVTVSNGVADQLDALLSSLLGDDNVLDSRITSLNTRISEIGDERTAAERRLTAIEKRYRAQFNALDSLLNELNSTGSFISDQLANIPLPGKTKK
jgi:flagellar hook-associated protein 2